MRIVKTGDKVSENAKKAENLASSRDAKVVKLADKKRKAMEEIDDAGLGDQLNRVTKGDAVVTPHLQEARKIYAKTVYGQALTPMFFRTAVDAYFKEVDETPTTFVTTTAKTVDLQNRRPYTVEGLCVKVGIDKGLVTRWANDASYGELTVIARMAMQKIAARLLDLGLMKEADSALVKFYLKNITDLKECMGDKDGVKIGNVTFVTVNSREEYVALKASDNAAIDIEAESV